MAIKTVAPQRQRSELKTFRQATIADLETDYNAYEVAQAADYTKTFQVKVSASGFDGEMFWVIAECTWPEISDDPLGQVPEAP